MGSMTETSSTQSLRLHIGGKSAHPDWKIVDIDPRPEVDYVLNANDLSQFADESVDAIYSSHVLEHFHHTLNNEVANVLKEWHRVLKPGGRLFISVPDLRTVSWLYLNPNLTPPERFYLTKIVYGSHSNQYDVHKAGFDYGILSMFLSETGYTDWEQISEFGLFPDCSSIRISGVLISLNVIAIK